MASQMHASQSRSHAGVWQQYLLTALCDIPHNGPACLPWSICLYAADLMACSCIPQLRYRLHRSCYLYNMSGNQVMSVHMRLVLPRCIAAWHVCLPLAAADGRWHCFVVDHCTEGSVKMALMYPVAA